MLPAPISGDHSPSPRSPCAQPPHPQHPLAVLLPHTSASAVGHRGVDDPDIPVLPEFMVLKIEEAAFFGTKRSKWTEGQSRSAKELYDTLPEVVSGV